MGYRLLIYECPALRADTGEKGVDVISLFYAISETITLRWEYDDETAGHYAVLSDSQDNEVLRVELTVNPSPKPSVLVTTPLTRIMMGRASRDTIQGGVPLH